MTALAALGRATRAVNRWFTALSGLIAVAIMVIIVQDVVRRYAFNDPSVWAYDLSSFMLCYLFFLALAPALESGHHVTVDLFERAWPDSFRRPAALAGWLFVIAFGAVLFLKLFEATYEAFVDNDLLPTAVPMKTKYVWMIGPIGALQFILTAIVLFGDALAGRDPPKREG